VKEAEAVEDIVANRTTTLTPTAHLATTAVEVGAAVEAIGAAVMEATEAVAEIGPHTTRINTTRDVASMSWEGCKIGKFRCRGVALRFRPTLSM
jgi:hypothetical protein